MSNNENSTGNSLWVAALLSGFLVYLTLVLPLRIIFRNRQNKFLDTLMPFSNILSAESVFAFFSYGLTTLCWAIVITNISAGYDNDLQNTFIVVGCFAGIMTIVSMVMIVLDVKNSME